MHNVFLNAKISDGHETISLNSYNYCHYKLCMKYIKILYLRSVNVLNPLTTYMYIKFRNFRNHCTCMNSSTIFNNNIF